MRHSFHEWAFPEGKYEQNMLITEKMMYNIYKRISPQ